MMMVNTDFITGKELETLGLVTGSTVQSRDVGHDIGAGLKNLVGGEVKSYTEMLVEARNEAMHRMVAQAQAMGADAVINVRFSSSAIMQGAAEIVASGTAVRYL